MAHLLVSYYPTQLALSDRSATEKQLNDSFEADFGVNGELRHKAVTFFLQAARFAGIKLSPHFPITRLGSGRPAGIRPKTTTPRKARTDNPSVGTPKGSLLSPKPAQGEQLTVRLGDAGFVTLLVDIRWLALPIDKLTAVRSAIKAIEDLAGEEGEEEDDP